MKHLLLLHMLKAEVMMKGWVFAAIFAYSWCAGAALTQGFIAGRPLDAPVINVRLNEGTTNVGGLVRMLSKESRNLIDRKKKMFSLPEDVLDNMVRGKKSVSGRPLPNLNLWVSLYLSSGASPADADSVIEELESLDAVDVVELRDEIPEEPRIEVQSQHDAHRKLAKTPDFQPCQGYLKPAPGGIDAEYAWSRGVTGRNVKIYDVEGGWNQNHEDLRLNVTILAEDKPSLKYYDHGTAVLGELVSLSDNGLGMNGADVGLAAVFKEEEDYQPEEAIIKAVNDGSPGDIILIEQQTKVCRTLNYGPSEWIQSVFDATATATANGFIVVAAAGNGGQDLNHEHCHRLFDITYRDSGAIIVGAGFPPGYYSYTDRSRFSWSSYGSRVDAQGWGSNVWTLGYGELHKDPDDAWNPDKHYTMFSGTSSAAPIVAGAAVLIQSYAKQEWGKILYPVEMRLIFLSTGSPQQGDTSKNIGKRPNLREAFDMVDEILSSEPGPTTPGSPSPALRPGPTSSSTSSPSQAPSTSYCEAFKPLPSAQPSTSPIASTFQPSWSPSANPTDRPSFLPSWKPSAFPSSMPSVSPSSEPSVPPSAAPSDKPTPSPSDRPSALPSSEPSLLPSYNPTASPSDMPTASLSSEPSLPPSAQPSDSHNTIAPIIAPRNHDTLVIMASLILVWIVVFSVALLVCYWRSANSHISKS